MGKLSLCAPSSEHIYEQYDECAQWTRVHTHTVMRARAHHRCEWITLDQGIAVTSPVESKNTEMNAVHLYCSRYIMMLSLFVTTLKCLMIPCSKHLYHIWSWVWKGNSSRRQDTVNVLCLFACPVCVFSATASHTHLRQQWWLKRTT